AAPSRPLCFSGFCEAAGIDTLTRIETIAMFNVLPARSMFFLLVRSFRFGSLRRGLLRQVSCALRGLDFVQLGVEPAGREQLLMCSLFHEFGVLNYKNNVRMPDRAQVMRHDNRRLAL